MTKQVETNVEVKAPSRIELAREIYQRIVEAGPQEVEGKVVTVRQQFIQAVDKELNMSLRGASTYYQNLKNEASGLGLYRNNKKLNVA